MKKLLSGILFLALVLVIVLYATGYFAGERVAPGETREVAGPPAPASTARAERVALPAHEDAVGTIQSRSRIEVAAQVTARIVELQHEAGDPVEAGRALVVLADRELKARLEQANQALAAAQASREQAQQARLSGDALLTQAQARHKRVLRLIEGSAATPEEMESAEAALLQARARVADADAAITAAEAGILRARRVVEEAEVALGHARIPAPITGVVAEKLVESGELAWPGRTLLVVLDPHALRLEARVREGLIGRVRPGARLSIELPAADRKVEGKVAEIIPAGDPRSRTFRVRVDLDETPAGVFPGMFGRLRIPLGTREVVRAPQSAVTRVGQLETVLVRIAQESWARRFVTTGNRFDDGSVEILSGLEGGETLGLEEAHR
jgi:RND family efflux transporter MFP subunit